MQLSARILTALAVLAFVVGVVVGAQNANDDVSAATGTIDALNVGTCTTTNADVFVIGNCTQLDAFYQQDKLEDLIEVDTLYATYAHDPATAAEAPRAILEDGDLVRISITDKGRDRRDPVLIPTDLSRLSAATGNQGIRSVETDHDNDPNTAAIPIEQFNVVEDDETTSAVDESYDAAPVVADALEVKVTDLPPFEQTIDFDQPGTGEDVTFEQSGTYEIIWEREDTTTDDFKPIAKDGVVKFFGRVNDGLGATAGDEIEGYGPFRDLSAFITLDEDVISGEPDEPPVMTLNISVPDPAGASGQAVQIQLIYYQTSGIEFIQGGDETAKCTANPHLSDDDRIKMQAACSSDEIKDGDAYVLYAESDEDAGDSIRHLALKETGRFTGTFQGLLRLTDADGDGTVGAGSDNWGRERGSGEYDHAPEDAEAENPTEAVIGVGNGPVTIRYKDTDGKNREYQIEIDITAPTISIDSPAHNSRSDDEKPSFIGTFNDSDSGLAANSFQLDVDNTDDRPSPEFVIDIDDGVSIAEGEEAARRRQDYIGYADGDGLYGVIKVSHEDIYKMEAEPAGGDAADYLSLEADDFDDGAPDGEFNGEIEVDFDEFDDNFEAFNNAIDFQALVRDLAGNVGFSDSDPAGPRFIGDLGEKETDRKSPNVIGVFSAHIVHVDEIDPHVMADASVTGFYGLNDDDIPVRDRSAVMVVFDSSVNGDLIDTGTFQLQKGEADAIEVVDVKVDGKLVFLKLGEELASDATPTLSITEGREVEDLAGNLLTWQEPIDGETGGDKEIKVKDGILPVFTVTLSGGSGTGIGVESPSRLTDNAMDIDIESDEDINGSPTVSIVCNNIQWTETADGKDTTKKLSDYIALRTGYTQGNNMDDDLSCGAPPDEGMAMPNDFPGSASLARPGNNWVYAWRNTATTQTARHLNDGKLTVVVSGRDRSTYDAHSSDIGCEGECENWGLQTVEFTLDDTFNSPLKADGSGGSVQPEADSDVKENRPFIYLDFAGENTSVTVTELTVDGEDVLGELDSVGDNRFLYWPEELAFGTHKVEFDARDAADNEPDGNTSFEFDVTARDPFVIDLTAGWNAISFPANPVDTALDAVFTEVAVDRVVGWNPLSSAGPWSIATRVDGVWTTSANFAPLTDVVVRYGYWVHSAAFVEQSVDLKGQLDRETDGAPAAIGIITVPGWNFVGVVDQDGDQTEDDFGKELRARDGDRNEIVSAEEYMGDFTRAYIWEPIANGYRILNDDDPMKIGQGIWVFFPDGTTVAP